MLKRAALLEGSPSGPSGKFCNAQSPAVGLKQGASRREWPALSKGCNAALAQLRVSLRAGPRVSSPALRSLELASASPTLTCLVDETRESAECYTTSRLAHQAVGKPRRLWQARGRFRSAVVKVAFSGGTGIPGTEATFLRRHLRLSSGLGALRIRNSRQRKKIIEQCVALLNKGGNFLPSRD